MSHLLNNITRLERPELALHNDLLLDFCLWPSISPQPISAGDSWRSINLLWHSFEVAGVTAQMMPICEAIRTELGDWKTVWGVKWADGQISWELYFYDYERIDRTSSATRLLKVLSKYVDCQVTIDEKSQYFMFSIDVDPQLITRQRSLDSINLYIGNVANHGSMISSGLCYRHTTNSSTLTNLYYFFDVERGQQDIYDKLILSIHTPFGALPMEQLLMPQLRNCRTIVVANKPTNDALYFSGITAKQLSYFFQRVGLASQLTDFFDNNRHRFDHLLFDVGADFTVVDGQLQFTKASYYGVF